MLQLLVGEGREKEIQGREGRRTFIRRSPSAVEPSWHSYASRVDVLLVSVSLENASLETRPEGLTAAAQGATRPV